MKCAYSLNTSVKLSFGKPSKVKFTGGSISRKLLRFSTFHSFWTAQRRLSLSGDQKDFQSEKILKCNRKARHAAEIIAPIRLATDDDVDALIELQNKSLPEISWSRQQLQDQLSNPLCTFLLADLSGRICGLAVAWTIADEIQVLEVAVDCELRRQGIGRCLLTKLMNQCGADVNTTFLEVRANNDGAIRMYKQMGFEGVGRRRGYYKDGEDATIMSRKPAAL